MGNIEQFKIPAYDKEDANGSWDEFQALRDEEKSSGSTVELDPEAQKKLDEIHRKKLFRLTQLMKEVA